MRVSHQALMYVSLIFSFRAEGAPTGAAADKQTEREERGEPLLKKQKKGLMTAFFASSTGVTEAAGGAAAAGPASKPAPAQAPVLAKLGAQKDTRKKPQVTDCSANRIAYANTVGWLID